MERSSWDCEAFKRDVIEFDVDKDIILNGLRLFVSKYNLYNLRYITVIPRQPIVFRSTFGDEIGKFNISFRAIGMPNFHRLEVMFNPKPSLKKNTLYHIMVLISGAKSGKGCEGLKTVKIAGVTFTFSRPC